MNQQTSSAAEHYAARVDAVLAQRTRLRGAEPAGDLFDGLPADHLLMKSDARRALEPNLEVIASYVEPDDVIVDVGGGAGRISLPLALRCREVINVDPSNGMGGGFRANAAKAGVENVRFIAADWLRAEPPEGTFALVNHVTYMTRDIVAFLTKLEQAGSRRVLITVNSPPPPSRNQKLFALVHGEPEEPIPGHRDLVNVLWSMGVEADIRMLSSTTAAPLPYPTREAAIAGSVAGIGAEQWSYWPMSRALEEHARDVIEARFDELFDTVPNGFRSNWMLLGREVLITWRPSQDRRSA